MTHPSIHQTKLAAALFDLAGGAVPNRCECETEARTLAEQLGDRSKILHKVIALCKDLETPEQLFLTARAYSFLGKPYAKETEKYASAYLSADSWQGLPHRAVGKEGGWDHYTTSDRACIMSDLAAAEEHLGKWEAAVSHYQEAYRLEPHLVMYAIKAADGMVRQGRREEALAFLRQQTKSSYYTPSQYRGRWGGLQNNDSFRELLNAYILKVEARET